jgi:hypothetical protein
MLTAGELAGMRETSQQAMPDVVRVSRPAAGSTFDPVTLIETPAAPQTIYQGAGRVRMPTPTEMERVFGDTEVTLLRLIVKVPADVTGVSRDDRVQVLSGTDPDVAQRSFRVTVVSTGSNWVDRTLGVEEVQR